MLIEALRAAAGLALTFFVPGYALILALYPKRKDLGGLERIALSAVLSMALTILSALFLDLVLGVDFSGKNMYIALTGLTALSFAAWFARTKGRYG